MKLDVMKLETLFLKITVVLAGIAVLALCIFVLPLIFNEAIRYYPGFIVYPIIIGMYVTTIPFYFALYQALNLLNNIDRDKAFSESSEKALKYIKYSATVIAVMYATAMPIFYIIGEKDDAPGMILVGLICTGAPIVIAVFASVLQKVLKKGIDTWQMG